MAIFGTSISSVIFWTWKKLLCNSYFCFEVPRWSLLFWKIFDKIHMRLLFLLNYPPPVLSSLSSLRVAQPWLLLFVDYFTADVIVRQTWNKNVSTEFPRSAGASRTGSSSSSVQPPPPSCMLCHATRFFSTARSQNERVITSHCY